MFLTGLKGAEISVGAFLGRGFVGFAYPGITSWEGVVARTPLREEFHKIGLGFPDFSDGQEHLHPSTPHFRNWGYLESSLLGLEELQGILGSQDPPPKKQESKSVRNVGGSADTEVWNSRDPPCGDIKGTLRNKKLLRDGSRREEVKEENVTIFFPWTQFLHGHGTGEPSSGGGVPPMSLWVKLLGTLDHEEQNPPQGPPEPHSSEGPPKVQNVTVKIHFPNKKEDFLPWPPRGRFHLAGKTAPN